MVNRVNTCTWSKFNSGSGGGVGRLCWHNFEHNRHIVLLRIMLA